MNRIKTELLHGELADASYYDAWVLWLTTHGVDPDHLSKLKDARDVLDQVDDLATELEQVQPAPVPVVVVDPAQSAAELLQSIRSSLSAPTRDELDAARAALSQRHNEANAAVRGTFRRYVRAHLIDGLTPHHDALVARATTLAALFPEALGKDTDADLGGRRAEWEELASVIEEWEELHTLLQSLREKGLLSASGRRKAREYNTLEFRFQDPEAATKALRLPAKRMRYARAMVTAKPRLLTVEDIDNLRAAAPSLTLNEDSDVRQLHAENLRRKRELDEWTAAGRAKAHRERLNARAERMRSTQ
ncbi:hypothetical protein [Microbacterium binotii]|uniref:hypothetical protein n=1 Tax=Microbacterium binotii TaxID=462710 RepID=UPI001F2CE9D8|nr:hypothetical protein [Microbacterium binotii]UIN30921.1 hypothetical protein LXM64_01560 [Microbacterium binotii]